MTTTDLRDGATVCGAIANLLRSTDPIDPHYETIRRCYAAALHAAGLSVTPGTTSDEFAVRWQRGPEPTRIDPNGSEGLMTGLRSYEEAELEGREPGANHGVVAFQIYRRVRYVGPWEQVGEVRAAPIQPGDGGTGREER